MKQSTSTVAGSVVLLIMLLLAACSSMPVITTAPRVSLVGLSVVNVELFEQRYQVQLRIKNPNNFELPVQGIDFHLDINGEDFADGVSNEAVTIPAYGEQVVALEVSSSLLQVFRQLQLLDGKQLSGFEYRITGNVSSGRYGWRMPFDFTGRLDAPKAPTGGQAKNVACFRQLSTKSVDNFVDEVYQTSFLWP